MRRNLAAIAAVASAALLLAAPASAATTTPAPTTPAASAAGSLVVEYKPGFSMVLGADRVTGGQAGNLSLGASAGTGMWVVDFAKPVDLATAQKVASDMAGSPAVAFAQANQKVGIPGRTPGQQPSTVTSLIVGYKPGFSMVLGADRVTGGQAGNLVLLARAPMTSRTVQIGFAKPVEAATAQRVADQLASSPAVASARLAVKDLPVKTWVRAVIVSFEKGYAPKGTAIPGLDKVSAAQRDNLVLGSALGAGMWRVDFKASVDQATAQKVADQLATSPAVAGAEIDAVMSTR